MPHDHEPRPSQLNLGKKSGARKAGHCVGVHEEQVNAAREKLRVAQPVGGEPGNGPQGGERSDGGKAAAKRGGRLGRPGHRIGARGAGERVKHGAERALRIASRACSRSVLST